MKKNMKWAALSLLTAGLLGAGTAGALVPKALAADEVPPTIQGVDISSFVMEIGAGVRVSGDGLRFSAEMSPETYEALEAKGAIYGMLIVPKDYLSEGYELTEENVFVNNKFFFEEENPTPGDGRRSMINLSTDALYSGDKDANIEIYGAITGLLVSNIYREFVGVGYVQVPTAFDETTGEATAYEYKFAQYYGGDMANNTRSMYYTAQRTLELTEEEWKGDREAVEANYITKYDEHIAQYGYTFDYTEKHVLTKLDGTQETLTEEIKYGDLNSTVSAEYYNDPALYSTYYCTDSEMPASKLYANGRTTLTVNYKETDVDFDNLIWHKELTESNFKSIYKSTVWGTAMGEDSGYYSITTEIPEGGVEGTYLYFNGSKYQATDDIQVHMEPAYSKGYYQSILNTGLPFVVKYDVYVENVDSSYSKTSTGLKGWNGTSSFNAGVDDTVTIGQWKTVTFDLSYLVNNWGNYRIFGLELGSYSTANQKVNFYLGNIRIEEKPKMWAKSNTFNDTTTLRNNLKVYNYSSEIGDGSFSIVTEAPEGAEPGNYLYYKQTANRPTVILNFTTQYNKAYYELLANCGEDYKITFDVYVVNLGTNTTKVKEHHWITSSGKYDNHSTLNFNTWYTVELDLATVVKNSWGKRVWGLYKNRAGQNADSYFSFYLGNMKLEKGTASTTLIPKA
ncbi:MAG: hypothetical protein IJD33_03070 [Clostridia bacterium]|nr:hypothetical protein [Clostridia bacterium]